MKQTSPPASGKRMNGSWRNALRLTLRVRAKLRTKRSTTFGMRWNFTSPHLWLRLLPMFGPSMSKPSFRPRSGRFSLSACCIGIYVLAYGPATSADTIATRADAIAMTADAIAIPADAFATTAGTIATSANAIATSADAIATTADAFATTADTIGTSTDVFAMTADAFATRADAFATTADAIATGAKALATGADTLANGVSLTAAAIISRNSYAHHPQSQAL